MTQSRVFALFILLLPAGARAHFSQQGRSLITNARELGDYKAVTKTGGPGLRVHPTSHCVLNPVTGSCLSASELTARIQFEHAKETPISLVSRELSIATVLPPRPLALDERYFYLVNVIESRATSTRTLPLCQDSEGNSIPALALSGGFSESGAYEPALANTLTFVCRDSVAFKCLSPTFGYATPAEYTACTRMFRADYCGEGDSYTLNDTPIEHYAPDPRRLPKEAGWNAAGALCLSKLRWSTIAPSGAFGGSLCKHLPDPRDPKNTAAKFCDDRTHGVSLAKDSLIFSGSEKMDRGLYTWRLDTAFSGPKRPPPLKDGICSEPTPHRLCNHTEIAALKDSYTTTRYLFGRPELPAIPWNVEDIEGTRELDIQYQYLRFEGTVFDKDLDWPPDAARPTGMPSTLVNLFSVKRTSPRGTVDWATTTAISGPARPSGVYTELYTEGKIFRPDTPCEYLPHVGLDKTSAVPLYRLYSFTKDDYFTTTDVPPSLKLGELHPDYDGYRLDRVEGYLVARHVDGLSTRLLDSLDCSSALRAPAGAAGGLTTASFDRQLTGDAAAAGAASDDPAYFGCTTTRRSAPAAASALLLLLALPAMLRRRIRATQ